MEITGTYFTDRTPVGLFFVNRTQPHPTASPNVSPDGSLL